MGILADIFVANDQDARLYEQRLFGHEAIESPSYERVQYKNITSLELGTLWALLHGEDWNVKKHNFLHIGHDEEVGSCLDQFPPELTRSLSALEPKQVSDVSAAWAATEELQWPASDAAEVINELVRLARLAVASGNSLYVWNCP